MKTLARLILTSALFVALRPGASADDEPIREFRVKDAAVFSVAFSEVTGAGVFDTRKFRGVCLRARFLRACLETAAML